MADFARSLISKIVADGDMGRALQAGVRATWFDEESDHIAVFKWMIEYFTRYGDTPTLDAFRSQFPTYKLPTANEPYEFYLDHFREQRTRSILSDTVIDANDALRDGETRDAQQILSAGMQRIGREITTTTDENAVGRLKSRYDAYKEAAKNYGKLAGIPCGFPSIDKATGGFQSEQFILLGGTAKQAKSFILMRWAMGAQDAGKRVLFMTFEMSRREQLARYDGIASGVSAKKLIDANLQTDDWRRLRKGLKSRRGLPRFVVSADISATTTVSGLAAKIEQYRPDIVFVDGCYLMDNEIGAEPLSTQAFTSISRGLKRLAQRTKLPVVGTTQALPSKMKDNKVTLYSFGWTSAWAQDADILFGISRDENGAMATIDLITGRSVSSAQILVSTNFSESAFEEIDASAEYEDEDDDEDK